MKYCKIVKVRKPRVCERCKSNININESAYRINTRFIKPFYRCIKCKITDNEIQEYISSECDLYNDDIEIDSGDF